MAVVLSGSRRSMMPPIPSSPPMVSPASSPPLSREPEDERHTGSSGKDVQPHHRAAWSRVDGNPAAPEERFSPGSEPPHASAAQRTSINVLQFRDRYPRRDPAPCRSGIRGGSTNLTHGGSHDARHRPACPSRSLRWLRPARRRAQVAARHRCGPDHRLTRKPLPRQPLPGLIAPPQRWQDPAIVIGCCPSQRFPSAAPVGSHSTAEMPRVLVTTHSCGSAQGGQRVCLSSARGRLLE